MRRAILIANGIRLQRRGRRLINRIKATPIEKRPHDWHRQLLELELGVLEVRDSLRSLGW